jgi:hypothetical protein
MERIGTLSAAVVEKLRISVSNDNRKEEPARQGGEDTDRAGPSTKSRREGRVSDGGKGRK